MAKFILPANGTYYAAIWDRDGNRWNGSAMAAPSTIADAAWGIGLVTLVELLTSDSSHTGIYTFTAPAGLPAGWYDVRIHSVNTFEEAANSLACMEFAYNGTTEVAELPAATAGAAGGLPVSTAGGLDLDAILADTNELQTNQGNWLTATGFAVAGDAMALTSGERTTLAATIWNALTSGLTTAGSIGKWLLDTMLLRTTWTDTKAGYLDATISSRGTSTLDAAGVRTAVGLGTANLDTQLADIPTVAEMNARTKLTADYADKTTLDVVAADVAGLDGATMRGTDNAALASAYTAARAAKLDNLDAAVSSIVTQTGTGARTVTITVNDGSDALENATVRMTNALVNRLGRTNASGVVVFGLDDATWTVVVTKDNYEFTPTTLVVNGNETQTYSMTAVASTSQVGDTDVLRRV